MCKKGFHLTLLMLVFLSSRLYAAGIPEIDPKLDRLATAVFSAYAHAYNKCMEEAMESYKGQCEKKMEHLKAKYGNSSTDGLPENFSTLKDLLRGAEWYLKVFRNVKDIRTECCDAINHPARDSFNSTKVASCALQQLRDDPNQELMFPYNTLQGGINFTKRAKLYRSCLADFWMQYPLMSMKTTKIENEDKSISFDLPIPYPDQGEAEKLPDRLRDLWVTCVEE